MSKLIFETASFYFKDGETIWKVQFVPGDHGINMRLLDAHLYKDDYNVFVSTGESCNAATAKNIINYYKQSIQQ
jgi:hypothetical protein